MMKKVLIALMSLLVMCSGQQDLANSVELDPTYKLSWEVDSNAGSIVMEIQAQTVGWVSLMITDKDGYHADLFWIGNGPPTNARVSYTSDMHFNLTSAGPGLGHTEPLVDAINDLTLLSYTYVFPNSIIRFSRPVDTGDKDDVAIYQGNYLIGWAYSNTSVAPFVHTATGFSILAFIS